MPESKYRITSAAALHNVHTLLDANEQTTMNLFLLIFESPDSMAWSDNRSFIIGQSNEKTPVWIWTSSADDETATVTAEILASRINTGKALHVNLLTEHSDALLRAAEKLGLKHSKYMDMNAYVCRKAVIPSRSGGNEGIFTPSDNDKAAMASLLCQLVEDGEHQTIPEEAANGFASAMVNSDRLFLWKDNGETVAMAMIAHKSDTEHSARINTVVTDRNKRGHGYAGALVAEICNNLLENGIIPMLYADAAYPSSNRAYQKIGFEPIGRITEYVVYKEN